MHTLREINIRIEETAIIKRQITTEIKTIEMPTLQNKTIIGISPQDETTKIDKMTTTIVEAKLHRDMIEEMSTTKEMTTTDTTLMNTTIVHRTTADMINRTTITQGMTTTGHRHHHHLTKIMI